MRRLSALVALAALAALAPAGAKADPAWCSSNVVIFSYTAGQAAVNSNAAVCIALGPDTDPYDGRLINPGSTAVSIRYILDLTVPTTDAIVNGLGFNNQTVTLTRRVLATGSAVYDSAVLPIDPAASGCITASVPAAEDSTAFHTLGASC